MKTLEQLAEKHCENAIDRDAPINTTYEFTIDQLRALIKEVVGEPVAWNIPGALTRDEGLAAANKGNITPLHALSVSLED